MTQEQNHVPRSTITVLVCLGLGSWAGVVMLGSDTLAARWAWGCLAGYCALTAWSLWRDLPAPVPPPDAAAWAPWRALHATAWALEVAPAEPAASVPAPTGAHTDVGRLVPPPPGVMAPTIGERLPVRRRRRRGGTPVETP